MFDTLATLDTSTTVRNGSTLSTIIPILVALVPWLGAWVLKRWRSPVETHESEMTRITAERDKARAEVIEDNVDLRSRLDRLEIRLADLEEENRRLRNTEYRQGRRIDVLERALRDANIPIPADWSFEA